MDRNGASDARRHLHRLLDRVARSESVTITRYGKPVARLVPVTSDRDRAKQAAAGIVLSGPGAAILKSRRPTSRYH